MSIFRKLLRNVGLAPESEPQGASGARLYAVGDIHGRLDLLDEMLFLIEQDQAALPKRQTYLVFLGDLIDRGPNSAEVIERLRLYRHDGVRPIFLAGNHEEVLLRVLKGEAQLLQQWLKFGGAECVASYGLDREALLRVTEDEAAGLLRSAIPPEHLRFFEGLVDTFRFGDYLLVHAGIRPGLELEAQSQSDLRWIREPFLSENQHHGFVVVHGHTIVPEVEERANRIGIDTGAYRTNRLTALAIEDERRWYLATSTKTM